MITMGLCQTCHTIQKRGTKCTICGNVVPEQKFQQQEYGCNFCGHIEVADSAEACDRLGSGSKCCPECGNAHMEWKGPLS